VIFELEEPKLLVALPSQQLAMSLFVRLQRFPGEKGVGVELPDHFEVALMEFPTTTEELDEVLDAVRAWLEDAELESVTVHVEGRARELKSGREP
jgi:hypothetical protein